MAYIESGMRTPGLFGLLLRPDLCPRPGTDEFEKGSKPAYEELIQAVKACTGGSEHDAALAELAWSSVHGFVELQWLLGVLDWEPKARAMLDRLGPLFYETNPRIKLHFVRAEIVILKILKPLTHFFVAADFRHRGDALRGLQHHFVDENRAIEA